jgi:protein required for attachment to host cells
VTNDGPGKGIEPRPDLDFRSEQRRLRDIMSDRPGRSFDSVGKGRHSMEYSSDPVREDERQFARTLVDLLEVELAANAFDRLVLVAPPQTLGDLRSMLSKRLRDHVFKELPKDLTRMPHDRLYDHLDRILLV